MGTENFYTYYYVTKWSFVLIKKTFKNIKIFSVAELTGHGVLIHFRKFRIKDVSREFPAGPQVRTFPAWDRGMTPAQGTRIPHSTGQLSLSAAAAEPRHHYWRACSTMKGPTLQLRSDAAK